MASLRMAKNSRGTVAKKNKEKVISKKTKLRPPNDVGHRPAREQGNKNFAS